METRWTDEMERAAREAVEDVPPRAPGPGGVGTVVLLRWDDYLWIRRTVHGVPEVAKARREGGGEFALLPLADYDRIKPFFEEDPPTREEQLAALRHVGIRAGWNDPEWDDFDREMNAHEPR